MPLVEEHVDVPTRIETKEKLNIFQRCSKKNPLPGAVQLSHIFPKNVIKYNVNELQHLSKTNPLQRIPCGNDTMKVVNGTYSLEGYIQANHQPT